MKTMWGVVAMVAFGLSAGHFAYQLLMTEPQFVVALERSFFQTVAIIVYTVVLRMEGKLK